MCAFLTRTLDGLNGFDGIGRLYVKGGPDVLVDLNVLGDCNIMRSANVPGGFVVPDNLNLRNDLDVLDGRKVYDQLLPNGLADPLGIELLEL